MSAEAFLDTNVLVYALAKDDTRASVARQLLSQGGAISVQVLNEFVSVARRKLSLDWSDISEALSAIRGLCDPPTPLTLEVHEAAVALAEAHDLNIYDALIVASAQRAKCRVLYSEDMQDGRSFDGGLTIRNPFKA
jgi:predicted nucleic acid-binding protein